jgi:succinylarginine dihydrolase
MNDIEQKALALINAEIDYDPTANDAHEYKALCRAIEQHEAFRQEVSDAVANALGSTRTLDEAHYALPLRRFIIPAPKPDPLIEVLRSVGGDDRDYCDYDIYVKEIRAALEARGLTITALEKD